MTSSRKCPTFNRASLVVLRFCAAFIVVAVLGLFVGQARGKDETDKKAADPAGWQEVTVTGRVLSPDGKAVANAQVSLVSFSTVSISGQKYSASGEVLNEVLVQGKSDDQGRFRLSARLPAITTAFKGVLALAAAPGYGQIGRA